MQLNLIDTHSHVNFNAYIDDGDKVIRRAFDHGIGMINVGSQFSTSRRAARMADSYEQGVYAAIGIHPIHLFETFIDEEETSFPTHGERFNEEEYQKLVAEYDKIVAVGEIGLDYFHIPETIKTLKHKNIKADDIKEVQEEELVKQIKFAANNNLPIILHCRGAKDDEMSADAYTDLYNIIKSQITNHKLQITGVTHCFVGNLELAQKFIDLGFYIGFTGIITFGKNADYVRDVARELPLERILVETDCPFLAPAPHRGERNEPAYVELVAQKIAEIKGIDIAEAKKVTLDNAKKLFKL